MTEASPHDGRTNLKGYFIRVSPPKMLVFSSGRIYFDRLVEVFHGSDGKTVPKRAESGGPIAVEVPVSRSRSVHRKAGQAVILRRSPKGWDDFFIRPSLVLDDFLSDRSSPLLEDQTFLMLYIGGRWERTP